MNTDPIADLLARIRNAQKAGHADLRLPSSVIKHRVASLLSEEGYVGDVNVEEKDTRKVLHIKLRYDEHQNGVIDGIERVSSPGMRVYSNHHDLPTVRGGMGTSILSTSRGIMTEKQARTQKVGGEVLCRVW